MLSIVYSQSYPQSAHFHLYPTMSARWCCGMAFLRHRDQILFIYLFFLRLPTDGVSVFPLYMRTAAVASASWLY